MYGLRKSLRDNNKVIGRKGSGRLALLSIVDVENVPIITEEYDDIVNGLYLIGLEYLSSRGLLNNKNRDIKAGSLEILNDWIAKRNEFELRLTQGNYDFKLIDRNSLYGDRLQRSLDPALVFAVQGAYEAVPIKR